MMINSFENYLKLGKVKKKTPDPEEANALFKQSEERMAYVKGKSTVNETAKFDLEGAYEAVREAAQSLMSAKGFKPYSHESTISFIMDYYKSEFTEEEIRKFDRFRQLRNDLNYKASPIMKEDAESSIQFAEIFIQKVRKLLEKQIKPWSFPAAILKK